MQNDEKIKELKKTIEAKKKKLGKPPKPHYSTNMLFILKNDIRINLNTIFCLNKLIACYAQLTMDSDYHESSCKALGLSIKEFPYKLNDFTANEWKKDIVARVKLLKYRDDACKLDRLKDKLHLLLSEEAKTAEELDSISKDLLD